MMRSRGRVEGGRGKGRREKGRRGEGEKGRRGYNELLPEVLSLLTFRKLMCYLY
jgi:hypothetical protein